MEITRKAKNIILNVVQAARKEGDLEFIKGVIAKGIMTRDMEGNVAADILTYLPPQDRW